MAMRSLLAAVLGLSMFGGQASAAVFTNIFTSFYVLGDSLSDDGNIFGPVWSFVTGGSPYQGNWRDGGTLTNGDVWNEPLQNTFRNAGRDADNFALGGALASGGNWVLPDLGGQIDKLLDSTSSGDRGKTPLISIWIGANNILDAVGDSDAMKTARKAANTVGKGIERLADAAGARDFVVFNLPNLARIPEFRLFDKRNQIEARDAGKEYNDTLARRIRALEQDGLNIIDIDIYSLFRDVMADPDTYGFENVKLPCVFPSRAAADRFDQRERCSASTAKGRLFMDALHPNSRAHRIIGDVVTAAITAEAEARSSPPAARFAAEAQVIPTPLPGSWILLSLALGALPALGASRRVSSSGPSPSPWPRGPRGLRHRRAPRCSTVSQDEQAAVEHDPEPWRCGQRWGRGA